MKKGRISLLKERLILNSIAGEAYLWRLRKE